jgi:hypothetical protein
VAELRVVIRGGRSADVSEKPKTPRKEEDR